MGMERGEGGGGGRGSSRAWRRSPRTRRLAKLPPRLPDPGRLHALAGPFPVFDQSSQIRGITAVEPARSFRPHIARSGLRELGALRTCKDFENSCAGSLYYIRILFVARF